MSRDCKECGGSGFITVWDAEGYPDEDNCPCADTDYEADRQAVHEAERVKAEAERVRTEHLQKAQAETLVALFDGDTQVSAWVPFADGKAQVPAEWMNQRYARNLLPTLQLRMENGNYVRPGTHVREHVVTTYSITWRTAW